MRKVSKVVIVPDKHVEDVKKSVWYYWCQQQLLKGFNVRRLGIPVILENMPDPYVAKRDVWLPFIQQELRCDENTVLIGHSSGAEAAMRLLEEQRVRGVVLVSACHTDQGNSEEQASGYYVGEWQWERIKANADWIVQFGSSDDPFITQQEMDFVHKKLGTEYHVHNNRGHFLNTEFPELVEVVLHKIELSELPHTPAGDEYQTHMWPK